MSGDYFETAAPELKVQMPEVNLTYSGKTKGFGMPFRVLDPSIPPQADEAVAGEGFRFTDGTVVLKDPSGVMTFFPSMDVLADQMQWAQVDWLHCGDSLTE